MGGPGGIRWLVRRVLDNGLKLYFEGLEKDCIHKESEAFIFRTHIWVIEFRFCFRGKYSDFSFLVKGF